MWVQKESQIQEKSWECLGSSSKRIIPWSGQGSTTCSNVTPGCYKCCKARLHLGISITESLKEIKFSANNTRFLLCHKVRNTCSRIFTQRFNLAVLYSSSTNGDLVRTALPFVFHTLFETRRIKYKNEYNRVNPYLRKQNVLNIFNYVI